MASPGANQVRSELGLEIEPPVLIGLPYANPVSPSEYAANAIATLNDQAELGLISDEEASRRMRELDDMRSKWGDGWSDRYGPLPNY